MTEGAIEHAARFAGIVFGSALSALCSAFISSFIAAVLLLLSANWVAAKKVGYWHAYWTSVICYLLASAVGVVLAVIWVILPQAITEVGSTTERLSLVLLSFLALPIYAAVYRVRLTVSLGRAAVVALVQYLLFIGLILLVGTTLFRCVARRGGGLSHRNTGLRWIRRVTEGAIEHAARFAGIVFGSALSALCSAFISSFIAAVLLLLSANWVAAKKVGYWHAYWTSVICYLLASAVGVVLAVIWVILPQAITEVGSTTERLSLVLLSFLALPIYAAVYRVRLTVSLGRAAVVALVQYLLFIGLILLVGTTLFLLWIIIFLVT